MHEKRKRLIVREVQRRGVEEFDRDREKERVKELVSK